MMAWKQLILLVLSFLFGILCSSLLMGEELKGNPLQTLQTQAELEILNDEGYVGLNNEATVVKATSHRLRIRHLPYSFDEGRGKSDYELNPIGHPNYLIPERFFKQKKKRTGFRELFGEFLESFENEVKKKKGDR